MRKILPFLFMFLVTVIFFWQFLSKGLLPIPADTIVGLYHPFRDLYAKNYPNGIPFRNFLITDPVRQQYPWRELAISLEKKLELPLWNPYNFAGTPLLANFQSASFYVLNILLFIFPFSIGWSLLIFLGPLLGGLFLFLYVDNLKFNKWAGLLGALTFSFSGFSVAWMEWGTVAHVVLWLPLILLATDKIVSGIKYHTLSIKNKNAIKWSAVYVFSLVSAFFAGHLQIFFYLWVFSFFYFIARWWQNSKKINILFLCFMLNAFFLILTSVQWIPTLQFILESARSIDIVDFNNPGWFIPWQHLIQFIAPDYFGNPATLNYWGAWNYGELVGYVGIMSLILAVFGIFYRKDKKTLFFGSIFFISLILSLPTFISKIPFLLHIPFIETSQPTRFLFLADFSLAVLASLGFDYFLRTKRKITIIYPLIFFSVIFICLWIFIPKEHLRIVKNNLILPSLLFACSWILFIGLIIFQKKNMVTTIICIIIVAVTAFDLLRFGWKFTPFTQKTYLFSQTKAIEFLQKNLGNFRFMTTDSRIFPPNFSSIYRLQSVDGYDPLYLQRYGELIVASERKKADITGPFGFNRIITPHNYESKVIDLLGVKYVLSLSELNSPNVRRVFQEGQTLIYENLNALQRIFFVQKIEKANNKKEALEIMFSDSFNPEITAVVEGADNRLNSIGELGVSEASIISYSENKVTIETENAKTGFLILTDTFYPIWRVSVDGKVGKIYRTDYNFRGIIVPTGKHTIIFSNSLF